FASLLIFLSRAQPLGFLLADSLCIRGSDLTDKANNQGKTLPYVAFGIPSNWPRKPAQRVVGGERARSRLSAILDSDPIAIISTHRRLRRGIPQNAIKR